MLQIAESEEDAEEVPTPTPHAPSGVAPHTAARPTPTGPAPSLAAPIPAARARHTAPATSGAAPNPAARARPTASAPSGAAPNPAARARPTAPATSGAAPNPAARARPTASAPSGAAPNPAGRARPTASAPSGAAPLPSTTPPPVAPTTSGASTAVTVHTPTVDSQQSSHVRASHHDTSHSSRRGMAVRKPGMSTERRMLRIHQQQARRQAAIQLQLHKIGRNVANVGDSVERMAAAMEANTAAVISQRTSARRRHRQLLTRLTAYTRSNYIMGNATSQLSRRCLAQQQQLIQCVEDVGRVLEQVTTAVLALHPTGEGNVGRDDTSECASSASSLSASMVGVLRRSTRPTAGTRAVPEEEPERRLGAARRRRN
ncbi:uncharacterized protein LOC144761277 [Lissotriton helveticus]